MNADILNRDLAHLRSTVRHQRIVSLGLGLFLGLSILTNFRMVGRETIQLVPPAIKQPNAAPNAAPTTRSNAASNTRRWSASFSRE